MGIEGRYFNIIKAIFNRDYIKNLLKLTHKFSEVAGHKTNIQISVVFLYINKLTEREFLKILFTVASKRKKITLK